MTEQIDRISRAADAFDAARIVSALGELRKASQSRRYGAGRLPELPSKARIVDLVEDLTAVLYPRHFGPCELTPETTDAYLIRTLDRALRALCEQIRRELALFDADKAAEAPRQAEEIARKFAAALPEARALLDKDIRAAFDGDPAAKSLDEVVFCYPGVAAVIRHRVAHRLYRLGAPMIARIIAEIAHAETGIDIHPGAQIDEGFFIDHGTGVVIGETTVIGKRVRLYQAVTLGAKRFAVDETGALEKGKPRHPIVEDEVVIYAGATVLGRITIGRGSSIGGNVWLTHSVPPGSNITQAKAHVEFFDHGAGI
ncbi:serine O-acetyltransferase EpsC [Methylocystis echinoides]|jgi:serine O-acetyltransferase|uniref:serine O-acetyltransferase EpsC n=1 Tax=Methylocystis echinoides TaxID=29468 RepID=UPI003418E9C6